MKTKKNNKLLRVLILFIFIISFFHFIFYIHLNSLNTTTVRKLESNNDFFKIFTIVVYLSYFVFIGMSIFVLGLIYCANGHQDSIIMYFYITNNGYLVLCAFCWFITGYYMVVIGSYISIVICVLGTIIILILKRNSINKCLDSSSLQYLFTILCEIWGLFSESIDKDCSCFYDSSSSCLNVIHYLYKSILGIGLGISSILYLGFLLILIFFWSILKVIAESISACCNCCKKRERKINNNVEINNNNDQINNNNQQENKILTINKPKETLNQNNNNNNNSDIKDEKKSESESETKKHLNKNSNNNSNNILNNNNSQNSKDEINGESNREIYCDNIMVKDSNV